MNPESNPETNGAADNPAAAPPPPGMEGQPVPGQTQPPPRIPSLSDKINWPTFGWLELTITLVLVGMVAGYFFTLTSWHQKWLEGRRQKKKWIAAQAGLDRAGLNPAEMESLEILADAQNQGELLDFLSIPPHLEISLHETLKHEPPERWGFTTRLRQAFRYQSYNLQIPLVSTRQLSLGDHVRITLWGGVMPKNYYGRVVESTLSNFAVELGGGGLEDAWEKKPEMDLYVLRSPDLETPFPCQVGGPSEQETRIVLEHALTAEGVVPRPSRMPVMRPMEFAEAMLAADPQMPHPARPDWSKLPTKPGLLYDLSEEGFAMVNPAPSSVGLFVYFLFEYNPKRPPLGLTGRVMDCREFLGSQFMVHCQFRDMPNTLRQFLHQLVKRQQKIRGDQLTVV